MNFRTFKLKRLTLAKEYWQRGFSNSPSHRQILLSHLIYEAPFKETAKLPFLITHGLLGSKQNFNSIAKAVSRATNRKVIIFDARNHGDSPHTDETSYEIMADDIAVLAKHLKIPKFSLMGHSMGARTAMTFALKNPDCLEKLVVVDMSPVSKAMDLGQMKGFIKTLLSIEFDSTVKQISEARKFADNKLKTVTPDVALRAFLLTNLSHKDGELHWKPNLPVLLRTLNEISEFPEELLAKEFSPPTLFIKGELSPYIAKSDFPLICKTFTNSTLTVINGSGHWPHADNAPTFLKHVISFLS